MWRHTLHILGQRPHIYNLIQSSVGSKRMWRKFVEQSVKLTHQIQWTSTDLWLDLGCGTAEILNHIPQNIPYLGIDSNPKYIDFAKKKYSHRPHCQFVCADWNSTEWRSNIEHKKIKIITLLGLLHHLQDDAAHTVLQLSVELLQPKGTLITLDGCKESGASLLEQMFYGIDRGQYVRSSVELCRLFPKEFKPNIESYTNWLRVPYRYALCHVVKP